MLTACALMWYTHLIILVRAVTENHTYNLLQRNAQPVVLVAVLTAWFVTSARFINGSISTMNEAMVPGYVFVVLQLFWARRER